MATLSSACYIRQQPGQPLKTLNVSNAILRTDKAPSSYRRPQCTAKRKSAVELLQETKSLYVKSETVLDRKQELRRSLRSSSSSDKGSSSHDVVSGCYHYKAGNCCNWSSGSFTCLPPPKSPRLVAGCQRKSTADSQQLQNDLRRLLNADSKENLFEATSVFLDEDVIVPPPVQYRRSVSHQQQQSSSSAAAAAAAAATVAAVAVSACYKSLPDLTVADDVVRTAAQQLDRTGSGQPSIRCRRSVSSGSVAGAEGADCDDDDDDDDDIFETFDGCCNIPSPHGFGNKSKPDETDAVANVTSFPDSLSLTSYKTDARWQQSAHGETGSSIEEEHDDNAALKYGSEGSASPRSSTSPIKSAVSQTRRRPPPPAIPARHQTPAAAAATTTTTTDGFRGRPILRSKSDVGYKAPNLLSLATATENGHQEYDAEQLENFFGHLGLDPEEYKSIMKNDESAEDTSSQLCFGDSNSSVGSVSGGSNHYGNGGVGGAGRNCGENGAAKTGGSSSSSELPSIVERNARIIKWLCNCRKANMSPPQQTIT